MPNVSGSSTFRVVAIGSPEDVEKVKLEEFRRLTPQQRLDLYMAQLSAWHNFDQLRLERNITWVELDSDGNRV